METRIRILENVFFRLTNEQVEELNTHAEVMIKSMIEPVYYVYFVREGE